jgi:ATP-binding cassette subfamily C (CFTR/MRP) protein 1
VVINREQRSCYSSRFQYRHQDLYLVLEAADKGRLLMPRWRGSPPEAISGILNRGLFWWVNELMGQGWRGLLDVDHLYPTDSALQSEKLLEDLGNVWSKRQHGKRRALVFALVKP